MKDVRDVCAEPHDPERPVVCFDETSTQLLGEPRPPLPAAPGKPLRYDEERERRGTRNLLAACEPKQGWRHAAVTERRTNVDFAHPMRRLAEEAYPQADVVRVVLDNLTTHRPGSLDAAFPPAEARRIVKRLGFHDTPKRGGWLTMAERGLRVFSRRCLGRRIPDERTWQTQVDAGEVERHTSRASVTWRFTTHDARRKLHRLYPADSS